MTREDKYNKKPDAPRLPKIQITKKPIIILMAIFVGLMVSGIIGMEYFDEEYTEDQLLTIAIQDKYPTKEDLFQALDSGEITKAELSNELQGWLYFQGSDYEFEKPTYTNGSIFTIP